MNWIKCSSSLPTLEDNGVLVYFSETGSIETVHIEDYFKDVTAGYDLNGKLTYVKMYLSAGITHWMPLPLPPERVL